MPTSCTGDADGRAVEARAGRAAVEADRRPLDAAAVVILENRRAGQVERRPLDQIPPPC